jgi:hypothetical protein
MNVERARGLSAVEYRRHAADIRPETRMLIDGELDRWFDTSQGREPSAPQGKAWLRALRDARAREGS